MEVGVWSEVKKIKDKELKNLSESLPDVLAKSKADSTSKNYSYGFLKWKRWAEKFTEVNVLPAEPVYIGLYLISLLTTLNSASGIDMAVSSLSWMHRVSGLADPVRDNFVSEVVSSLKRQLSGAKVKKDVVTVEMLHKLYDWSFPLVCLKRMRLLCLSVVSFAGFLRFDEISKIKLKHVVIGEQYMIIFLPSSKTDQFRDGDKVVIAKTNSDLCPVTLLASYISLANIKDKDEYIFRAIAPKKDGSYVLRKLNKPISYTRCREIFLEGFKEAGVSVDNLGLHSLRAGGVTAGANAGLADRLLMRHGRWKSAMSKDGYIKDDKNSLLSVSKKLGL